ncbi:hypothetical protein ACIQ7N_01680 [Lysinibacillus sp. NPDC095746]|uniref:hypothetical protein n=1 Tax=Lysinibacillus sp. NPDC095746 TaxID=3364134 RepID=UPI00382C1798
MFKNEYLLDVDLKFKYTSLIPVFRRGDTAVLKFRIHDNGGLYDISTFDNAELTIIMPSGATLKANGNSEVLDGLKIIKFLFQPIHTVEIGTYNVILTLSNNNSKVSIQPIKVRFFDNLNSANLNFLQLIQDLQLKLDNFGNLLNDKISIKDKGIANGVVSLDQEGKIPDEQLPKSMSEHLDKLVYLEGVHGMRVNKDGALQYETTIGDWKDAEFSETPISHGIRLQLSTKVNNGLVSLKYTGKGHAVLQKWMIGDKLITDFALNGTEFTELTLNVTNLGVHTIYYKDEIGNEYVHKFNVVMEDLKEPTVNIDIENSVGTIDSQEDITVIKWDKGIHDVTHFRNNGTIITDNSFIVTEAGTYTLYYKLVNGLEYVKVFTVYEHQLDKILPIVNSSVDILKNIATITITASDEGSGIHSIKKPDGSIIYATTTTYTTTANGSYEFIVSDKAGNQLIHTVTVDQIDLDPPIISLSSAPQTFTNKDVTVNVTISDVNEVPLIKWASGNQTTSFFQNNGNTISNNSFIVSDNGIYTVYAKDRFGNAAVKSITIENIDKIPPTATTTQTKSGNDVIITVTANDMESGVYKIVKPDSTEIYSSTTTYKVSNNGTYKFVIYDKANNNYTLDVKVSSIINGAEILKNAKFFAGYNAKSGFYLTTSGDVYAVGDGGFGTGMPSSIRDAILPIKISSISNVVEITTDIAQGNSIFKTSNGKWYVTGRFAHRYANNSGSTASSYDLLEVTILPNIVKMDILNNTAVYLTTSGEIYTVGNTPYAGIMPSGSNASDKLLKVPISGVQDFILSNQITYYKKTDGWYSAGYSVASYGMNGTLAPTKINTLGTVQEIIPQRTSGATPTFIKTSNGLYAEGINVGNIGDGSVGENGYMETYRSTPIPNISKVFVPDSDKLFVGNTSGTLYAVGRNNYGSLGIGSNVNTNTPIIIRSITNITDIQGTSWNTYFKTGGQWYAAGEGDNYKLGNGSRSNSNIPVLITAFSNVGLTLVDLHPFDGGFVGLASNGYWYAVGKGSASGINGSSGFAESNATIIDTVIIP